MDRTTLVVFIIIHRRYPCIGVSHLNNRSIKMWSGSFRIQLQGEVLDLRGLEWNQELLSGEEAENRWIPRSRKPSDGFGKTYS